MNESGTLNLKRFEMFLREFSKNDMKNFVEMMDDESYMSSKRRPDAWKGRSHGDSEKVGNTIFLQASCKLLSSGSIGICHN